MFRILRRQQTYLRTVRVVLRQHPWSSELIDTPTVRMLSNCLWKYSNPRENLCLNRLVSATALISVAVLSTGVTVMYPYSHCEEIDSSHKLDQEGDAEADDPYQNLPEEDEETSCSICQRFRKGPCRPYWRKLERCFKDNEGKENASQSCMRYFKPHQKCLSDYINLYYLISLETDQQLANDVELSMAEDERRTWDPAVDWTTLRKFTAEAGSSFKETIQSRDESGALLPLWKRLPENREPVLLTIPAQLPTVDKESSFLLRVAYAIDQDGLVLSVAYNKEFSERLEKAREKESGEEVGAPEAKDDTSDQEAKEDVQSEAVLNLDFFVLPGETRTVQICGMYSEDPLTAGSDKEILDALLFKSKPHDLSKIAKNS